MSCSAREGLILLAYYAFPLMYMYIHMPDVFLVSSYAFLSKAFIILSSGTIDMIQNEPGILPRVGVITAAGLGGAIAGFRGKRKLLYNTVHYSMVLDTSGFKFIPTCIQNML